LGLLAFEFLPKRGIVERTFGGLTRYRRHSRDHEKRIEHGAAMIEIGLIHLMSRRLEKNAAS
jgi:transposase